MKTINIVRGFFVLLLLVAVMTPLTAEQEPAKIHLMPWPASLKIGAGQLAISNSFSLAVRGGDPRLRKAAAIFLNDLRRQTGMLPLDFTVTDSADASLSIHSDHPSKEVQELGEDESYALEISATGAKLDAPTTLGVMRGLQTFLQLVRITPQGFAVPAVSIQDAPRFPWRGLLIDPGRHFVPVDVIKRNLDGMAAVKLNVLHWHLSEYQGFRVESKRFPKLHEMGSDGLYYTQDEIREVVTYARDRGIRIVPEFDMPGHSTSWFVGYPELASGPGPYSIERRWGVFDPAIDPTKESTYKFLDGFIGEMGALFPDQFFHVGGDEVNGKQWDANPKIQEFMRAHGLKNNADLQAYFNQRLQKIVAKHGKTMEGWDEILRPELPKSIVIQSWRGPQSLADATRQGYRGLLSSGYYLDLMSPTSTHYGVDPFADGAANLSDAEKQRVLGGEACMWGEFVSGENIDSRIWPRMAAIAERLWSRQAITDVNSMYDRLDEISKWLDFYGLKHNVNRELMLRRMAGGEGGSALRTLADVVEPTKGYSREALATSQPTAFTPLNRLIDAAQPESATARRFSAMVDLLISGKMKPGTEIQIRAMLTKWRDNDMKLRALAAKSSLVEEVAPLSQDLSTLGTLGLQALDYLARAEHPPEAWTSQQLALVQQAFQPKAQVLLMIAPAVQKLIQASAGEKPTELPIPRSAQD
jgi:hexosaminidase